ncbi:MAG: calcium/sodium antiporter [Myxococcales bacterium]|nr:calcium/sodium antiporter [Myxococcales bacterium]MCB9519884.1 calcium/sodium antiporter [Myxococcales bacterium]MCB9533209.1 calcium/sodium antiporter [Myxococcales bacterium]
MLIDAVLLVVGLAILYFGAEWLVDGASALALDRGVSPLIVGLTVVAVATSLPELVVSMLAALEGAPDIALGNVVGSNIANIALILGAAALVTPLPVEADILRRDYPTMMIGFVAIAAFATSHHVVGQGEGIVLLCLQAAFVAICVRQAVGDSRRLAATTDLDARPPRRTARNVAFVILGLLALVGGARVMVDAAVRIARELDVPELVIGATVVAVGTSLPELATSVVAALRRQPALCIGNVVGSNIFNASFVLGGVAVVSPIPVAGSALALHIPAMMLVGVLLLPMMARSRMVSRASGVVLLATYGCYVAVSVVGAS